MKKLFSILMCGILVAACVLATFSTNKESILTPVRDVDLIEQNVDYQALFEEFENVELILNEKEQYIYFSGIQKISSSEFEELDLVSVTNDKRDQIDVQYSFEYYQETNLFTLNVKVVNLDAGEILDSVQGMPFINENGKTDIAFVLDYKVVLLSEMQGNFFLENCGWFSNAWNKLKKATVAIVAVAAVVAIVVVAAPAIAAAVPVLASGLSVSGGALALSGGTAAAAMAAAGTAATAAAVTYLPMVAVATATSLAIASVDAGIEAAKEENSVSPNDSTNIREVEKESLPKNAQDAYDSYDDINWDGEIYTEDDSKSNANTEYKNRDGKLPKKDAQGNDITYREYDVNDCKYGNNRDSERFVKGSDGSIYYTNDHYGTFKRIK